MILYGLSVSPFTLRARWALDYHGIPYSYREYLTLVDEPLLKLRARRWDATVPLLVGSGTRIMDSTAIARWAEANTQAPSKPKLFPTAFADLERWIEQSHLLLNADRGLFCVRVLRTPEELDLHIPWRHPSFLRPFFRAVTASGIRYIAKSFGVSRHKEAEYLAQIRTLIQQASDALARHPDSSSLLGALTFADIAWAAAVRLMTPRLTPEIYTEFRPIYAWAESVKKRVSSEA